MEGFIHQHCLCKASKTLTYWQPALRMAIVRSLNTRNICPLEAVGSTCSSSVIFLRRIYPLEQVESRARGVNLQYQACLACSLSASVQCWLHICPQCNPQTSRASGSLLTGGYPKNNDPSEKHTLNPYTETHLPLQKWPDSPLPKTLDTTFPLCLLILLLL